MLLDLQLDASPDRSFERARELVDAGAAGLFTFEGPHDVFLPLAAAAGRVDADLMTNVAIAMPRSPMHLAHAAWDLQLMSGGRFRLGLGSQVKPHIEKRYGATWSPPAARMREIVLAVKAILDSWQHGTPLRFEGEHTRHTLMPPTFVPGPNPHGPPPVLLGALGPADDTHGSRGGRRAAGDALPQPPPLPRADPPRGRGGPASARAGTSVDIYPQAILAMGTTDAERAAATEAARGLLAFYGSTPAYLPVLEVEGWARGAAGAELPLQARRHRVDDVAGDRRDGARRWPSSGRPRSAPPSSVRRFGDVADRVCAYFPGYDPGVEQIASLARALAGGAVTREPG